MIILSLVKYQELCIFSFYVSFYVYQEQAIRSGKSYDSVANTDRDGYGQPDGE